MTSSSELPAGGEAAAAASSAADVPRDAAANAPASPPPDRAAAPEAARAGAGRGRRSSRYDRSIVDGPLRSAVWKLAWPTMLQNIVGGMQGIVDHTMVGHIVGFQGNAAIGVSWQIFLVVIVFEASIFTGMGVLIARFAGAGDEEKVDRTVYQAFLTAAGLSFGVLAPVGYLLAPSLLDLVNATPAVQAEALPYLRIMFLFSFGMMVFFMLSGALRSAGDARTPLRYGIAMTVLNVVLNIIFISGLGPVPAMGTKGAAVGTVLAGATIAGVAIWRLFGKSWVVGFPERGKRSLDLHVIRELFRFGLPTGLQGIAMNVAGVFLLRFIGSLPRSAEAQAAYAITYTQLFSFITWTSVGLMGAAAAVAGQNLGARQPDRSAAAPGAASRVGLLLAGSIGLAFLLIPRTLLGLFGVEDAAVIALGVQLMRYLSVSGLFVSVALAYTGALQGTGDTKSPLYISIISQIVVPLGLCAILQATGNLTSSGIWTAILLGHITRCGLSVARFQQGEWRAITVDIGTRP